MTKRPARGFEGRLFDDAQVAEVRPSDQAPDQVDPPAKQRRSPSQRAKRATATISAQPDQEAKGDEKHVQAAGAEVGGDFLARFAWLLGVCRRFSNVALVKTAAALAHRAGYEGCFASASNMARDVGLDPRNVQRSIAKLKYAGLLSIESGGGRSRPNKYILRQGSAVVSQSGNYGTQNLNYGTQNLNYGTQDQKQASPHYKNSINSINRRPLLSAGSKKKKNGRPLKNEIKDPKPTPWGVWIDCNRGAGRKDPLAIGPDTQAAKTLGKLITDPGELKKIFDDYLADQDLFLSKQGWPLRLLPGRANGYRNGSTPAGHQETEREAVDRIARELRAQKGK